MQNENLEMGIGQNENASNLIKHGTNNEYFPGKFHLFLNPAFLCIANLAFFLVETTPFFLIPSLMNI